MKAPRTLGVWLSDTLVGYLTHYPDERTVFSVSEEYLDAGPARPILSLAWTHPDDEAQTRRLLLDPRHKSASIKSPPFFSNLLPEGGMRARIAQQLKVHEDREFLLLEALGHDLPGAVILRPVDAPPPGHRHHATQAGTPPINADTADDGVPQTADSAHLKFSLGGMQLKFSMLRQGERYTLNTGGRLGNYIIKPPSRDFPGLPQVEAAAMATARAVGIDVPETLRHPPLRPERHLPPIKQQHCAPGPERTHPRRRLRPSIQPAHQPEIQPHQLRHDGNDAAAIRRWYR